MHGKNARNIWLTLSSLASSSRALHSWSIGPFWTAKALTQLNQASGGFADPTRFFKVASNGNRLVVSSSNLRRSRGASLATES